MKKYASFLKIYFIVLTVFFSTISNTVLADDETQVSKPYVMHENQSAPSASEEKTTAKTTEHTTTSSPNDPSRLNAGDHLRIYVFGVPDLTGEFEVDTKGMITMPLIGEIKAEGLDKNELQNTISKLLINGQYFNDPKVTVEIIALQPFYILGEVNSPGSYPYVADLDVFKAIAIAGGYTPRASKEKITIIRKVHNEKTKIKATEDTPLLPGDSIKVEERFF